METSKIPTTVRKVRGTSSTKNPMMVRKIHGTNRPWYETSTNGTKRLRYEKSMVRKVRHSHLHRRP